jgi:membrane protease YdiL (CAAX protease family)
MQFKHFIQKYPVPGYFILTFVVSWSGAFMLVAPDLFHKQPLTKLDGLLMFPVMILGPALVSILLTRILEGKQGLKNLWSKILKWRLPLKWWLVAFLIPPCLILVTLFLLKAFISDSFTPNFFPVGILFGIPAGFLEETGWSGFAFPRLRLKQPFFKAAIILGLFWSLWHLPVIDFLGAASPHGEYLIPFFLAFTAILTAMRLLIAWLYTNTNSILLAQFTHVISTGSLVVFGPFAVSPAQETLWYACYAILLWIVVLILLLKKSSGPNRLI